MRSDTYLLGALTVSSCLVSSVASWQQEVHNQIGFMADDLINDKTRAVVEKILEPQYQGSLGLAAGWADTVRKTTHRYSYGWHFISARDNPPNDCGLYYHRDCQAGGCVVQQIANQTNILEGCLENLRDDKDYLPPVKCSEALKWVTHFVGDVAQPLHTSERSYGGNAVKVKFNGTDTNLHQVWDQLILYAMAPFPNGASGKEIEPYFDDLVGRILGDDFRTPRSLWTMCDLDARRGTFCAEQWAKDSNAIVCDYAYGRLVEGNDLFTGDDGYAKGAEHIIEEQLAKAAWRLSGWLNALVERVLVATEDNEPSHEDQALLRFQRGRADRARARIGQSSVEEL